MDYRGDCREAREAVGERPNFVVVVVVATSDSVRWPYAQPSFLLLLCEEVVIARGALVDC